MKSGPFLNAQTLSPCRERAERIAIVASVLPPLPLVEETTRRGMARTELFSDPERPEDGLVMTEPASGVPKPPPLNSRRRRAPPFRVGSGSARPSASWELGAADSSAHVWEFQEAWSARGPSHVRAASVRPLAGSVEKRSTARPEPIGAVERGPPCDPRP